MKIIEQSPALDTILESWRPSLVADFTAYSNHCHRVLNFCTAFCGESEEAIEKVSIATAFHDLGIWANNTFDYLGPSRQLARVHLAEIHREGWGEEIEAMIEQHHKVSKFSGHPGWLVEPFRKADWIDVSKGMLRFGLTPAFVNEVMARFPNSGFHRRLMALTWQRLKTHPLSPLPMMKL